MDKAILKPEEFPRKINDNVFMLGNYYFNIYLIIGDKKTAIFETGISAFIDSVISQIESLGVSPDYIIPAHPHSDHITGLPGLREKYPDARVIAAQGAKEFLEHPKAAKLLIKEDSFLNKSIAQRGIIPGREPLKVIPDLSNTFIVENKESLDLGNITLDLIKADGHSPGNLIARIPELGIVFTSDSLGFHYPGRFFCPLFFTGLQEYLAAIALIKSFNPLIICPAHQGNIAGKAVKGAINETLDATLKIAGLINNKKQTDYELAEKLFKYYYVDEFTIYTESNIKNCMNLLIKRAKEANEILSS